MPYCKAPAAHRIKIGTTFYSASGWVDESNKVKVDGDGQETDQLWSDAGRPRST